MYFYVLFFLKLTFIVTIKSYICHTQYLYDHLNIRLNHVFVVYLVLLSSLMGPLQNVRPPTSDTSFSRNVYAVFFFLC